MNLSFLGLSGYNREFIKDYAYIAKPLTKYLKGKNAHAVESDLRNVKITLDNEALIAFDKLKRY